MNVILNPVERRHLVEHPGVARHLPGAQREEAEGPQPVVEGDEDNVVHHPELGPEPARRARAEHEGAPV